jgi:hypothetical protein
VKHQASWVHELEAGLVEPEMLPDNRTSAPRHTSQLGAAIKAIVDGVTSLVQLMQANGELSEECTRMVATVLEGEVVRRNRQVLEDKHKQPAKRRRVTADMPDASYMRTALRAAVKENYASLHAEDQGAVPAFHTWAQALAEVRVAEGWVPPTAGAARSLAAEPAAAAAREACRAVVATTSPQVDSLRTQVPALCAATYGVGMDDAKRALERLQPELAALLAVLVAASCVGVPECTELTHVVKNLLDSVEAVVPLGPDGLAWPAARPSAQEVQPQRVVPRAGAPDGADGHTGLLSSMTTSAAGGASRSHQVTADRDRTMRGALDGGHQIVSTESHAICRASLHLDKFTGKVSVATSGFEDNVLSELVNMLPKMHLTRKPLVAKRYEHDPQKPGKLKASMVTSTVPAAPGTSTVPAASGASGASGASAASAASAAM